jgi:hypothetical protein
MGFASLVVGAVVVLLLLATALLLLLRSRTDARHALAAARAETAELRDRLDALTERFEGSSAAIVTGGEETYVITDAGGAEAPVPVPDRVVLSATLGEPLVKVVAFGHGMRQALSAESRNRIWFEMRREVRASRKRRRRENRAFIREARAAGRAADRPDAA